MNFGVLMQILITTMNTGQKSKFCKFKMADGRHIENGYRYISAADRPMSMKFRVLMHILVPRMGT